MYTLEFTYRFETAHRFTKGSSKCATPHGHTWYATLSYTANSGELNEHDMVEAFENLKRGWKAFLTETVDHSFLHHYQDPLLPALREFVPDFRGLAFPCDPTTEVIAALFLRKARAMGADLPVRPSAVTIQETPTNRLRLDREGLAEVLREIHLEKFKGWWENAAPDSRAFSPVK